MKDKPRLIHFATPLLAVLLAVLAIHAPANAYGEGCPKRIISLSLASDEIILDIISDKSRIAGITYLAADEAVSNVASKAKGIKGIHANLEQVLELEPDLVIVAKFTSPNFIRQLENAGANVLLLKDLNSFQEIRENIEAIGRAICERDNAEALVGKMDEELAEIGRSLPKSPRRLRVLYYSLSGFTAGAHTTMGEIIEKAGALNLAAQAGISGHKKISIESVISLNPDVIILSSDNPSDKDSVQGFISRSTLRKLDAVREGRVIIMQAKHMTTASHYIVGGVRELAKKFQRIKIKTDDDNKT